MLLMLALLVLWQAKISASTHACTAKEYTTETYKTDDGFRYTIYKYTNKPNSDYAYLYDIPDQPTVVIPSDIVYDGVTYPVKSIYSTFASGTKYVDNIYFSQAIPEDGDSFKYYERYLCIHVPESLYDTALERFGNYAHVTDGTRTGYTATETQYHRIDNIDYSIDLTASPQVATVIDFKDTTILRIPADITVDNATYPVTGVSMRRYATSKVNTRDIYFSRFFNYGMGTKYDIRSLITAHVPDSLYEQALPASYYSESKYTYGKVTNGASYSYHYIVHPYNISSAQYYDIDGTGEMDIIGTVSEGSSAGDLLVSSIKGDVIRQKKILDGYYYGQFGFIGEKNEPHMFYAYYNDDEPALFYNYTTDEDVLEDNNFVGSVTFADIDGDGNNEVVGKLQEGYVDVMRQKNGEWVKDKLFITTDTTVLKVQQLESYTPNSSAITSGGSGGGSITTRNDMFVKAKPYPQFEENADTSSTPNVVFKAEGNMLKAVPYSTSTAISVSDINGDGMLDFSDGTNIYYNLGNSKFFKSPHVGTVYSTDLTGNGLLDFIDFGAKQVDLYLNMVDGSDTTVKTLLKNTAISNVMFGDFDKDGDVDILFFIKQSGYCLFQFYRNDGNGTFKAKDTSVDGEWTCWDFKDYDGDGQYEILAYSYDSSTSRYTIRLMRINKNWTVTEEDFVNGSYWEQDGYNKRLVLGDVDNDGYTEVISNARSRYYTSYDKLSNATKNTCPQKMEKPQAVAYPDAGKLKISWKRGNDAQTSSCDLTYELRIGTQSDKGDVYYAFSNADGTRCVLEDGNMGRALSYMFDTDNLNEGKYYISVQAIDAGGLGGAWSDDFVYDHKLTAPTISTLASGYCTADTIDITVKNPNANATYEWTLGNGTIISQNANASNIKVVFEKAGTQNVSVAMTMGGKTMKSETKTISLFASKYPTLSVGGDYSLTSPYFFMDLDQDGNAEIYSYYDQVQDGFYEHKNSIYSLVRKSWNTDISGGWKFFIADFNHDGYPDFYLDNIDKGNVFTNDGEQDKSFEYDTETFSNFLPSEYYSDSYALIDINNDGRIGYKKYNKNGHNYILPSYYKSNGDERTFESIGISYDDIFDFDRDGGLDVWKNVTDRTEGKAKTQVYLKTAGGDYAYNTDSPKTFYENSNAYKMIGFADFNNDGYVDGYYFDGSIYFGNYNMVIVKGKPMSQWPCTQTVVIPLSGSYIKLIDFDNNGYLDIYQSDGTVLLMDKDFSYTEIKNANDEFGLKFEYVDDYHWMPLTPGAYPNGYESNVKNEAPSAPANVTAAATEEGLLLKWDDAEDDHTPWMHMRYNVSLKVKGKMGENAFVLSPLNGLSDDAAICSGVDYRKATQMVVPPSALTDGTTYEVQVQAIDLMGEHSPMSPAVEVLYNTQYAITLGNTTFYPNTAYTISYAGCSTSSYDINPGEDGSAYVKNGKVCVGWGSAGQKTITATANGKTFTRTITVDEKPVCKLDLPEKVMINTPLTVKVPETFTSGKFEKAFISSSNNYSLSYNEGDSLATITFRKAGTCYVNCYLVRKDGVDVGDYSTTIVIDQEMPQATIESVEADGNCYRVNWNTELSSMVDRVEISRETNHLDQFEVLDVVSAASGTYLDETSDNRVQAQRYRIRLLADNDAQTSDYSTPHNPLHVMINQAANGTGYNLMWNAYEGLTIDSYSILRGTSANKLKEIAQVAGSQQYYTDTTAPASTCYYAVRFNGTQPASYAKGIAETQSVETENGASNVVSTEDAMQTTAATSITIGTIESTAELTQSQKSLHLKAIILPAYCTYNKVSWTIVSGEEYATVNQSGVLTATGGKGTVVVKVTTLDGSRISSEISIPCDVTFYATALDIYAPKTTVEVGESIQLSAYITPKNAATQAVRWVTAQDNGVVSIDQDGVLKGLSTGRVGIAAWTTDGTEIRSKIVYITVVEASGIEGVNADDDADIKYYDLSGRRVLHPQKGQIYVTNKKTKIMY